MGVSCRISPRLVSLSVRQRAEGLTALTGSWDDNAHREQLCQLHLTMVFAHHAGTVGAGAESPGGPALIFSRAGVGRIAKAARLPPAR